jgi:hypothetical protein
MANSRVRRRRAKFQAMPRGRHRQAPPLHRLLLPLSVGGTAVALAVGSLAVADPLMLRAVVAAAAGAACTAAVVLRRWDQAAGKSVAELKAARQRDEWRTDERIAELEVDLEDSRELRGRLENKLRAKRAELARLRTDHAGLLRRYATSESERARVLEDRRLALGAGDTARRSAAEGAGPSRFPVDADAYAKAERALLNLSRNDAARQAIRTIEGARCDLPRAGGEDGDEPQERQPADFAELPALPALEFRGVPEVAAVVLPCSTPQRVGTASRAQGGFDFFGKAKQGSEEDDMADVVGDEVVAEQRASNVIDLTAHDETENIDVLEFKASRTS